MKSRSRVNLGADADVDFSIIDSFAWVQTKCMNTLLKFPVFDETQNSLQVTDEIYEIRSGKTFKFGLARNSLYLWKYTDNEKTLPIMSVYLPSPNWRWVDEWKLEVEENCDPETGWSFSRALVSTKWKPIPYKFGPYVCRRKWVRTRLCAPYSLDFCFSKSDSIDYKSISACDTLKRSCSPISESTLLDIERLHSDYERLNKIAKICAEEPNSVPLIFSSICKESFFKCFKYERNALKAFEMLSSKSLLSAHELEQLFVNLKFIESFNELRRIMHVSIKQ